jgi:hypothetical protein
MTRLAVGASFGLLGDAFTRPASTTRSSQRTLPGCKDRLDLRVLQGLPSSVRRHDLNHMRVRPGGYVIPNTTAPRGGRASDHNALS